MSAYRPIFAALDDLDELRTCLHAVGELLSTDTSLDANTNCGRDRLAVLLGRLRREQEAALDALREAPRAAS